MNLTIKSKVLTVRLSFLVGLLALITVISGCKRVKVIEQPFITVDKELVKGKIPENLQMISKEIVQTRFAKFNFNFFQKHLMQKGNDFIKVQLFDTVNISLRTDSLTLQRDSIYIWYGSPKAQVYGKISLAFSRQTIYGIIQIDSRIFEILPVYNDIVRISEIDQTKYPEEARPIQKKDRINIVGKQQKHYDKSVNVTIKVLVVLPQPTYSFLCGSGYFPTLFRHLFEYVYEDNLNGVFNAFYPTNVKSDIIFDCYDYTPVGGDLVDDLVWLKSNDGIASLRDKHNADLVCLIVPEGNYCGLGYENYPVESADADYAFSVVKADCALSNYSFAHELGHNLGMRHDRTADNAFSSPTCNYGYIFDIKIFNMNFKYRTVMAYGSSCNNCPRIGVYSNPMVKSLGIITIGPMGLDCNNPPVSNTYDRANNRQQLIDAAPIVSNFR